MKPQTIFVRGEVCNCGRVHAIQDKCFKALEDRLRYEQGDSGREIERLRRNLEVSEKVVNKLLRRDLEVSKKVVNKLSSKLLSLGQSQSHLRMWIEEASSQMYGA